MMVSLAQGSWSRPVRRWEMTTDRENHDGRRPSCFSKSEVIFGTVAERAQQMSAQMGCHWGQVDAEEVLTVVDQE